MTVNAQYIHFDISVTLLPGSGNTIFLVCPEGYVLMQEIQAPKLEGEAFCFLSTRANEVCFLEARKIQIPATNRSEYLSILEYLCPSKFMHEP